MLWATAFYAGLRRMQALQWSDVDLARGVIKVDRSWDQKEGLVRPKSAAGHRSVPIAAVLRDYLVRHRMTRPDGLVFARRDGTRFSPATVSQRAERAWERASIKPVTLHECRHTFATLMIAAGVNAKALQTFMGHSSITVTLDRYGHLFPGSEEQAAVLLDAYLAEAYERGREADIEAVGKVWEKLPPIGAVLTGLERQSKHPYRLARRRGNCPHKERFLRVSAEREGFEPSMDETAHTGFRDRRIQPLCHLSGVGERQR